MKGIFLVLLGVLVAFVLSTSPVFKRWGGAYLAPLRTVQQEAPAVLLSTNVPPDSFKCDGRKYCSQMTSCAEAKSFLTYCPGTKMDGDHNGIPCESQWCRKGARRTPAGRWIN
ncbi:excalibur calcium-binding domain-containing protein [Pseudomonas sp. LP_7_YM]|uniref:excalibur calcium-binding domain-containing protein n=1 Tax=Pseudomonas sp. LP_7_YM TaxID=2485137 RepID=UPI0010620017|nr:excalibur calcium-binding domain-containing protein [Pseudomonas sp. LP_7_YM]